MRATSRRSTIAVAPIVPPTTALRLLFPDASEGDEPDVDVGEVEELKGLEVRLGSLIKRRYTLTVGLQQ